MEEFESEAVVARRRGRMRGGHQPVNTSASFRLTGLPHHALAIALVSSEYYFCCLHSLLNQQ